MFTRFFIDRPIFASVLSIVITLAGGLALASLPIAMFPQIAPPTVSVNCQYPGASAQVVAETVAAPIEQQVNGVERMMYMSSQCTNDGVYNLTVTFELGTDLNMDSFTNDRVLGTERNGYRTAAQRFLDLKLSRDWSVMKKAKFTFSVEVFNLLNRTDTYPRVRTKSGSTDAAVTLETVQNAISTPRQMQIGARLAF